MVFPRHKRTLRSHRCSPGGLLILVMALVVLALSPLAGEIGAAQDATDSDQEITCDEGFVLDEATGECVPADAPLECDEGFVLDDATGECVPADAPPECDEGFVFDEAVGECVESPDDALIPAADEPRQLAINKFFCPAGYTVTNRDPGQMISDCDDPSISVEFTVSDGGGGYSSTQQTTSGDASGAIFTDVPAGNSINVTETIPDGYGAPIVFCHGENTEGTIVQPVEDMIVENGRVYVDNREVFLTLCYWFNLSTLEPTGTGTVYVNKHACPSGYDASAHDMYEMAATCHDDAGVVNFSVFEYGGGGYDGGIKPTSGGPGPNLVTFENVPNVKLTIYEEPVAGYTDAVVFCKVETGLGDDVLPTTYIPYEGGFNTIPVEAPGEGNVVFCDWYNLPTFEPAGDGNTVTIYKWICPDGTVYDQDLEWYETNCTQYSDDFGFTLTSTAGTTSTTPNTGQYQWVDVPMGPIGIQETIPYEYGAPVVYCGFSTNEGGNPPELEQLQLDRYDAPTGYVAYEFPEATGHNFFCQWFNIPGDPGEITIYKWTCPEGYDLYAYGASPFDDCTDATNGVTFFLDQPDPADTDLQTDTGDSIDGAVYFGGLKPGSYVVTEEVPADTAYVFVLDCYGTRDGKVHPYPLSFGDTLTVDVFGSDKIVCHWFNVPDYDYGKVTVVKYICATKTFKSDVDCQVYEDGATFDLLSGGAVVDTKTTDGFGKIIWIDVEPGNYWLDEHDRSWCAIGSDKLAADKESFVVEQGQETLVKVYNCTSSTTPGGKTGKQPTKYPNTGVGPATDGGGSGPAELPTAAPLLGLGLFFRRVRSLRFGAMRMAMRSRQLATTALALPMVGLIALLAFGPAMAQTGTPGTDSSGTPEARLCLPGGTSGADLDTTPDESGDAPTESAEIVLADEAGSHDAGADEDTCVRGAVPMHIVIEAANVDAEIEVLETVAGVMEAPSGADDVAWYKETARLGEPGNIVMAGHLNYWGVPEGVFFSLNTLQEGDTIEVTGDDGEVVTYTVQWVRQEDSTQPPSDDVLDATGVESLTLITCGGEWDASISEYNERTVARAVRATDAEATPGSGPGD